MSAFAKMDIKEFMNDREQRIALLARNEGKTKAIKKVLTEHEFVEKDELTERLIMSQWHSQYSIAQRLNSGEAILEGIKVELDRTRGIPGSKFYTIATNLYKACTESGKVVDK